MKANFFRNFRAGLVLVLPIIIFFWILNWLKKILFGISESILDFNIIPLDSEYEVIWNIVIIIILSLFILLIGYFVNHYYLGKRIVKFFLPMINKIPVLNILFRVSQQIEDALNKKNSFKKVVLVEFPIAGVYSIGFITGDKTDIFGNILGGKYVSVFIPTTPNPTNGFLTLVESSKVKVINISVQRAIEYIISMGTIVIDINDLNDLVS
ncbi:MAG: DUF502 domain-containing protein [Candidatus Absconditabacteria bacterium]|nr:DUF502 domain-containing protein [Candidatus Absconditabacteria bacterium]